MLSTATVNISAGGLPWVRRVTSPYTVQLHFGLVHQISGLASSTPARPPPRCHIAGSLSTTYMGSTSCFLQTSCFQKCPCLVGVALPSGNGGLVAGLSRPFSKRAMPGARELPKPKGIGLPASQRFADHPKRCSVLHQQFSVNVSNFLNVLSFTNFYLC